MSEVCPGREHDTTAARAHPSLLAALDEWTDESHVALADLSYEGENSRLVCRSRPAGVALTAEQGTVNAQLEATFKTLRRTYAGPACAPGVSALSPLLRWFYFARTQPTSMVNALLERLPVRDAVLTVPCDRSPM